MNFAGLQVSIDEQVGEVRLNMPETLNSFDDELHHSFTAALDFLSRQELVRCILLSAEGRVFSAGGNFDYLLRIADDPAARKNLYELARRLYATFVGVHIPIVAALHGDAFGLGATLITTSDIVVATPKARLGDPHVMVGMSAGDGGVVSWSLAAGLMRAKRYLLTGDYLSAAEAHRFGLVTDLVDDPQGVRGEALRIARRIAKLPPLAVQGTKRAFARLLQDQGMGAFELGLAHEIRCFDSKDFRAAVLAAKEKRQETYQGY